MTNEVELFSWAFHFFVKYLFKSFVHVSHCVICLLSLSCKGYLFILNINYLSDIHIVNIFFLSVVYPLILLTVSFDEQKFKNF